MSAYWIKELNKSESRLHKEEVLKKAYTAAAIGNKTASTFITLLGACYDPFSTYGVKQIPTTDGIVGGENPYEDFMGLLNRLAKRELSGNAARDAIQSMAERFDSDEWNTFAAAVLRRDVRAGISTSTINKVFKGTPYEVATFECQLATNCEGRPEMRGIKRLEPKLDGVRVLMVVDLGPGSTPTITVTSYSRNGKVFENFTGIENQIKANLTPIMSAFGRNGGWYSFVLDGEVVGNSFQELMRQARRKTDVQADDSVFHVFDIIPLVDFRKKIWSTPLSDRIALLETMRSTFDRMPNLELLPHIQVNLDTAEGKSELEKYASEMVALGYEGIMIKDLDQPYVCDRSTAWMKWKPTITVDLQIVGSEEGTGRNEGRLGALICAGVDNGREITVNVGSGYDDQLRAQIWADITNTTVTWEKKVNKVWVTMTETPSGTQHIGNTVEVMADAVTQNRDGTYSLRFPRFVRFRDDK